MKILLISSSSLNFERQKKRYVLDSTSAIFEKPVTLLVLSSLTTKKHSVDIYEKQTLKIDIVKNYDIVGISFVTEDALRVYEIADEIRNSGVTVIFGGIHPSALPEEAKQHADAVVIGEAEDTWPQLLNDFENGNLKPFYRATEPVDPKKIPVLNDAISRKQNHVVFATRGCPNRCEFCSLSNKNFGNVFRMRPIENVIDEIRSMRSKNFVFNDPSLTINPNYTKQLFKEVKHFNKKFTALGNTDYLGKDDNFLKLARDAGCIGWYVGFDSIDQKAIDSIGKPNKVNDYKNIIKKIHDCGMFVEGSIILGFDSDNLDAFDKTYDFIVESEMDIAELNILTPYPGTRLFDRLQKEKRILTYDWSKYNQSNVVYSPKNMTKEQLHENVFDLYKKLHSSKNVFLRTKKGLKLDFYSFLSISMKNVFRYIDLYRL